MLYYHPSVLVSSDLDHSKKQVMGKLMKLPYFDNLWKQQNANAKLTGRGISHKLQDAMLSLFRPKCHSITT